MEVAKITSSQQAMDMEARYGAHNYHPLGVVIARGKGPFVWDVEIGRASCRERVSLCV